MRARRRARFAKCFGVKPTNRSDALSSRTRRSKGTNDACRITSPSLAKLTRPVSNAASHRAESRSPLCTSRRWGIVSRGPANPRPNRPRSSARYCHVLASAVSMQQRHGTAAPGTLRLAESSRPITETHGFVCGAAIEDGRRAPICCSVIGRDQDGCPGRPQFGPQVTDKKDG
jgi:hypothetical protein